MKILVISKEAWRDEQSGGNVLSNIFNEVDAQFAQIYCNENLPNNNLCKHYYRITDRQMLRSIFRSEKAGKRLDFDTYPIDTKSQKESFSGGKKWLGSFLGTLREVVWGLGKWNEKEIRQFIEDFNPDLIFAPCYGNMYMHKLTHIAKSVSGVNVISYISDDHYSLNQIRWEPWFWINQFFLRRATRKVFNQYSLVYTMTEGQKEMCEKEFGANMKILRKSGEFDSERLKKNVGFPIKIIYAGGVYLNRWKTLVALVDAISKIDNSGNTFQLDIYTNNPLNSRMQKVLNDGILSRVHPVVPMEELKEKYHNSDIALHCESFDIINRHKVRLSFSTKIVDCIDSGCAVMAICDSKQAGWKYLHDNDAGICIDNPRNIYNTLLQIKNDPSILIDYQHKAFQLGRRNHDIKQNTAELKNDFIELSNKY